MSAKVRFAGVLACASAALLATSGGAGSSTPSAPSPWMSEAAMRQAFIGKTLDGHYADGTAWTEVYFGDGRLDYREGRRRAVGRWHFHGHVFCTFYDPPPLRPPLNGGCWTAVAVGANCYEFYLAGLRPDPPFDDAAPGMELRWNARAWRTDEPATCNAKPSV